MKYARHRSNLKKKKPVKIFLPLGIIVVIVLMIILAIGKEQEREVEPEEIVSEETNEDTAPIMVNESTQRSTQQITLRSESSEYSATARRGVENGLFTHVIVADLPPLSESADYYEGWLVKPGVVEFFSTGELFLRADGKWGLLFELREENTRMNLFDYSRVIITREKRDGNPPPTSDHILEGEFMQ